MAVFSEPTKWQTSLVNSGDANVIPQSTPAGTGEASFDDGFPQITQVPIGAGGIAPDRKDFNGLFKILGDWIFYAQNGGLPTYNPLYDYVEGRIVLHTDNKIYFCIQANGALDPKAPSDSAYWSLIPTLADELGFKTGDIKIQTTSTIPTGWLLCNGASISRSTFSNLFTKIGTTYGTGDGSTTFNIPDLRDRYIIGANTNALGTYLAEQLPNITGGICPTTYNGNWLTSENSTGALQALAQSVNNFSAANSEAVIKDRGIAFNAHNSNSIYTDNGKIYPASIALNFIIKT